MKKPAIALSVFATLATLSNLAFAESARVKSGYVLTHEHPTYGMAFGGNYAFAGASGNFRNGIMVKGYTAACGGCKVASKCDHGEVKGSLIARIGSMGSDMGDHKSHKGPRAEANSHLRYSTEWVKAAFEGPDPRREDARMRIMVAFAVENEAMCEQLYYVNKNGKGGPGGDGYPCSRGDSVESLDRQLDALKAWVRENPWMEIAYSAADAERIVNADKLAIILGVESEYSFGAENRTFDPVDRLNHYHAKGVRTFYLAHKINSRLSGADIYYPKDTDPGKAIRATQAISGCFYYDDNVGQFPLKNRDGHNFCDNKCGANHFKGKKLGGLSDACAGKFSEISEVNMADYVMARGNNTFNGFNIYPLPPGFKGSGGSRMDKGVERNNLGLSHDGERVVREAMRKGMIVNIDHVSSNARRDIHAIATGAFGGYPLNALHNNPNSRLVGSTGKKKTPFPHEYDFDDAELKFVRDTGGFFGVRLGPLSAADYPASGVTRKCPKTSTESAKILAYLLDFGMNVGYSLDFATVTQGVHSRKFEGCGVDIGDDQIHKYGAEVAEGISHVGMMKEWHNELATVGLKSKYLSQLKNDGVAAFIAMWKRAADKSTVGQQIPRQTFENSPSTDKTCAEDSDCKSDEYCGDPIVGKSQCKPLKDRGDGCSKGRQCKSGKCKVFKCAR
ncbi:MAG: membrane dipeptidase [Deltaproteobacteria bacterium]|nr:membrane dipeptidase [Deltaproteobacteria bacterium]